MKTAKAILDKEWFKEATQEEMARALQKVREEAVMEYRKQLRSHEMDTYYSIKDEKIPFIKPLPRATRAQFMKAVRSIHPDIEVEVDDDLTAELVAPQGHHFDNGLHAFFVANNKATCKAEFYAEAIEDIKIYSVQPCTAEDCGEWEHGECQVWAEH